MRAALFKQHPGYYDVASAPPAAQLMAWPISGRAARCFVQWSVVVFPTYRSVFSCSMDCGGVVLTIPYGFHVEEFLEATWWLLLAER